MTAHFGAGEDIPTRRLRDVEVSYVFDPSLETRQDSSDDCPVTPPPTYYLKVGGIDGVAGAGGSAKWAWRYVDVENRLLRVAERRGGTILHSAHLSRVLLLRVVPEPDSLASTLEVHIGERPPPGAAMPPPPPPLADQHLLNRELAAPAAATAPAEAVAVTKPAEAESAAVKLAKAAATLGPASAVGAAAAAAAGELAKKLTTKIEVLTLQARSRRETLLWAEVLQENIEQLVGRRVHIENLDSECVGDRGDDQKLAMLLMHQLSKLEKAQPVPPVEEGA